MKVYHAMIAYMPSRHQRAEEITREAVAGAVELGYPLVIWHAGNKPTPGPLCAEIHPIIDPGAGKGEIVDYENGNLSDNWLQAWDDMFLAGADWVLWTSNDVVWTKESRGYLDKIAEEGNHNTVYEQPPFIWGMFHKDLWAKVREHWDVVWEPSMNDDSNFLATVLWQGGAVEPHPFQHQVKHHGRIVETTYTSSGKPKQEKDAAILSNNKKFKERWGISPYEWPVPGRMDRREPLDVPPPPPPAKRVSRLLGTY